MARFIWQSGGGYSTLAYAEDDIFEVINREQVPIDQIGRMDYLLAPTIWNPVAIKTTGGFVILEMSDSNWISNQHVLGTGNIVEFRDVGPARHPELILTQLRNAVGLPFDSFLRDHLNYFGIYRDSENELWYRGTDGRYYSVRDNGFAIETDYTTISLAGIIQVDYQNSAYLLKQEEGALVIFFNSRGGIVQSFLIGDYQSGQPFDDWTPFPIPLSLHPEGDQLNLSPIIRNSEVENRLNYLESLHLNIDQYSSLIIYQGRSSTFYLRRPTGQIVNLATNEIVPSIPGLTALFGADPFRYREIILVTNNAMIRLVGLTSEGRIDLISSTDNSQTTGEHVYTIIEGDHRLYDLIQRNRERYTDLFGTNINQERNIFQPANRPPIQRSTGGLRFGRMSLDDVQAVVEKPSLEQTVLLMKQSYDRYMAELYGLPLPEVNNLNGYSRVDFSEFERLRDSGQVVRYEIPPGLQPFAGLPTGPNRIVSFQTSDGQKLFTKAGYDPKGLNLYPPV